MSLADRPWATLGRTLASSVLLAWGAVIVALAVRLAGKEMDDLFITYRYALHLV